MMKHTCRKFHLHDSSAGIICCSREGRIDFSTVPPSKHNDMQSLLSSILIILLPYISYKLFSIRSQIVKSFDSILSFFYTFYCTVAYIEDPAIVKALSTFLSELQHNSTNLTVLQHKEEFILVPYNDGFMVQLNDGRQFHIQHQERFVQDTRVVKFVVTVYERNRHDWIRDLVQLAMKRLHHKGELFELAPSGYYWKRIREGLPNVQRHSESSSTEGNRGTTSTQNPLILPPGFYEDVVSRLSHFKSQKEWYSNMGIPFRIGILLHGPSGNGKTSMVIQLAKQLGMTVCILNLSSVYLTDDRLSHVLRQRHKNSILLFEDIHAIFDKERTSQKKNRLTFSGLLNALDGIGAPEGGLISFFTTDDIKKLDPALIRPGRCDVKLHFSNATTHQIDAYFRRMFPDASEELCRRFAESVPEGLVSMQLLQNHLLQYRSSAEEAVNHCEELLSRASNDDTMDSTFQHSMPLDKFLHRLGLSCYTQDFVEMDIFSVGDLIPFSPPTLNLIKGMTTLEKDRMTCMLQGPDSRTKARFQLATPLQIRGELLKRFPSEEDEPYRDQFHSQLTMNQRDGTTNVSFFQLDHHFHKWKTLKQCIDHMDELLDPPLHRSTAEKQYCKGLFTASDDVLLWLNSLPLKGEATELAKYLKSELGIFTLKELVEGDVDWKEACGTVFESADVENARLLQKEQDKLG